MCFPGTRHVNGPSNLHPFLVLPSLIFDGTPRNLPRNRTIRNRTRAEREIPVPTGSCDDPVRRNDQSAFSPAVPDVQGLLAFFRSYGIGKFQAGSAKGALGWGFKMLNRVVG